MKLKSLDWLYILILAEFGVVMGVLSVNGLTRNIAPYLWLVFGGISAWVLVKKVQRKLFVHGLFVGLFWALINALIQSLFFDSYLVHNPGHVSVFGENPIMNPRYLTILVSPIYGLMMGAIIGVMALLIKKLPSK